MFPQQIYAIFACLFHGTRQSALSCGKSECVGKEQCFGGSCFCLPPYFPARYLEIASVPPCSVELCGVHTISAEIIRSFQDKASSSTPQFCQFGTCRRTVNQSGVAEYHCECYSKFYVGSRCEVRWDPCQSNPCLNDGTCVVTGEAAEFLCICHSFYKGSLCHQTSQECLAQPCMNGAMCLNLNHAVNGRLYQCLCPPGYGGTTCEDNSRVLARRRMNLSVIASVSFLIISLLMCCTATSQYRQKHTNVGIVRKHPPGRKLMMLERLFKLGDAVDKAERSGAMASFYALMGMEGFEEHRSRARRYSGPPEVSVHPAKRQKRFSGPPGLTLAQSRSGLSIVSFTTEKGRRKSSAHSSLDPAKSFGSMSSRRSMSIAVSEPIKMRKKTKKKRTKRKNSGV